jgi:hypothetical protein
MIDYPVSFLEITRMLILVRIRVGFRRSYNSTGLQASSRTCTGPRSPFQAPQESRRHPPSRSTRCPGSASPRPHPRPTCTPSELSPPWGSRAPSASRSPQPSPAGDSARRRTTPSARHLRHRTGPTI